MPLPFTTFEPVQFLLAHRWVFERQHELKLAILLLDKVAAWNLHTEAEHANSRSGSSSAVSNRPSNLWASVPKMGVGQ